jgi:hypothetical protein
MLYDVTISGNCEIHGMELKEQMDSVLNSLNEDTEINQADTGFGFGSRDHYFFELEKNEVTQLVGYYLDRLGDKVDIAIGGSPADTEE